HPDAVDGQQQSGVEGIALGYGQGQDGGEDWAGTKPGHTAGGSEQQGANKPRFLVGALLQGPGSGKCFGQIKTKPGCLGKPQEHEDYRSDDNQRVAVLG